MKVFVENIVWDELQWKKPLRHDIIGRQCSMILLIIANVAKAKMKKTCDVKVKKWVFETGDLMVIYDSRHFRRAHKKYYPNDLDCMKLKKFLRQMVPYLYAIWMEQIIRIGLIMTS
jgi:hypothetical protein